MSTTGGGTEHVGEGGKPAATPAKTVEAETSRPNEGRKDSPAQSHANNGKDTKVAENHPSSPTPQAQHTAYPQLYHQLTPQPGAGYYLYQQHQVTPEPPSPAGPGGSGMYDVSSFLHQQAALAQHSLISNPFGANGQYNGIPQAPLSPGGRSGMNGTGGIPPASPLFPRVANSAGVLDPGLDPAGLQRMSSNGAPPSPVVPYLSPPLGPTGGSAYGAMYQGYGVYGNPNGGGVNSTSMEENAWSERLQNLYQQASPQPYGAGMTRTPASNRSYSFDEMLPPSVLDHQDHSNPAYSPYGGSQTASGSAGATLFAHQQWGYGSSGDVYNTPQSPVQPRQTIHQMHGHFAGGPHGMPAAMRLPPYGQQTAAPFYPATSPGPPIQTTASNKGPDGANLFIFHIPNHFTNLDMYHLFCQYGNLLSVRIMVEKDTGRSRGFGFVSYDSPESAAMAIKELNGFAIGNKRLKVQHKQIRANDHHSADYDGGGGYSRGEISSTMPSSNPEDWYGVQKPAPQSMPDDSGERIEDHNQGDQHGMLDGNEEENAPIAGTASEHSKAGVDLSRIAGSGNLSPLANLEPLRNSLPDVSSDKAVE